MKILFVCTGNLCRSPMAEALLKRALAERGCDGIEVASVGTWAHPGWHATPEAVDTMRARGIDLAEHRSRPPEQEELVAADLIVVMTSVHEREIRMLAPDVVVKVVLLKELPELGLGDLPPDVTREGRLKALLALPRPKRRRALDLDDPIGLPLGAYERCADELSKDIDILVDVLCR